MRFIMLIFLCLIIMISVSGHKAFPENGASVSLNFLEFFPSNKHSEGEPFEMVFNLENTGNKPINPYAEVTVSGSVVDKDENIVIRLTDKKFRVYNLWPGDTSARCKFYIGVLAKGDYKLMLNINTFSKTKGVSLSNTKYSTNITVN